MACPFAQLSPLLLLSFLALFFQFGASFFSPKPLMASLQRGRSFSGEEENHHRTGLLVVRLVFLAPRYRGPVAEFPPLSCDEGVLDHFAVFFILFPFFLYFFTWK